MGIIDVDFDIIGHLLIMYFAFVKYVKENRNTMRRCILIDFEKACDSFRGVWYPYRISEANKSVPKWNLAESVGKHLSYTFPIKNGLKRGVTLSSSLYKMSFTTAHANQGGLILSGTHQFLFYAEYFNIVGRSIHTTKNKTGNRLSFISFHFTFHWSYTDVELVMYIFSIINVTSVYSA